MINNLPGENYLNASTLRAIRFLDEISVELWEKVFSYSINGSLDERLMATQTWLYRRQESIQYVENSTVLNKLQRRLSDPDLESNRLQKNYILILAAFGQGSELGEYSYDFTDSILYDAHIISLADIVDDLFYLPEPSVLRKKYYSIEIDKDILEAEQDYI